MSSAGRVLNWTLLALAAVVLVIFAYNSCNKTFTQRGEEQADAGGYAEPLLASRYDSTWGELHWQGRKMNTITFVTEGETVFMRCTVEASPVVLCRWSKEIPGSLGQWDRGKAKLKVQADRSLTGTWGKGSSDSDGGQYVMKPLANP